MCPPNSIRKLLLKPTLVAPVFIWKIQVHISIFVPVRAAMATSLPCPHFPHPCSLFSPVLSLCSLSQPASVRVLSRQQGPKWKLEYGAAPSPIPLLLPSPSLSPSGCSAFQQIQQLCSLPGEAPAFKCAGEPKTWFQSLFQGRFAQ